MYAWPQVWNPELAVVRAQINRIGMHLDINLCAYAYACPHVNHIVQLACSPGVSESPSFSHVIFASPVAS